MSYDVWVEADLCPQCGCNPAPGTQWNYTSNMGPAWRAAGADLAEFDGRPAHECAAVLAQAIETMEADPERFRAFDSPNGWGTMETLLPALRDLLATLRVLPGATVRVSR